MKSRATGHSRIRTKPPRKARALRSEISIRATNLRRHQISHPVSRPRAAAVISPATPPATVEGSHWQRRNPMPRLDGKIAIVTGSDSGNGQAIAENLAQVGADIVVVFLKDRDGAEKTR